MKILDTQKAKQIAEHEQEVREYTEWLNQMKDIMDQTTFDGFSAQIIDIFTADEIDNLLRILDDEEEI